MLVQNIVETDFGDGQFPHITLNDHTADTLQVETALQKIKSCQHLTINCNSLTELKGNLSHIENLSRLRLSLPNVEYIAEEFFSKNLTEINITAKNLTHLPCDLFQNQNLEGLSITCSSLQLPPNINLPELHRLSLDIIFLNTIPSKLLSKKMTYLQIKSKVLTALPPDLSECVLLKRIQVQARLEQSIPDLSKLTALNGIYFTELRTKCFQSGKQLPPNLLHIHISSEVPIEQFTNISNLSCLSSVHLTNFISFPQGLGHCHALKNLTFIQNESTVFPDLSSCKNLERLQINAVPLSEFPECIFELSNLESLMLSKTKITALPENWQEMPMLSSLNLTDNKLSISDFSFVDKLPKIKDLYLTGNKLANPYALISKKKIPISDSYSFFQNINYQRTNPYSKQKEPGFLEFCSALGRANIPMNEKKWFFDLISNHHSIEYLPQLDFPHFLMALCINFKPLRSLLERKLVRDVLIQHLEEMDIFQNPFVFDGAPEFKEGDCILLTGKTILPKSEIKVTAESLDLEVVYRLSSKVTHVVLGKDAENWKKASESTAYQIITESSLRAYFSKRKPKFLEVEESTGDSSMTEKIIKLLEHTDEQNILLGLELMKGGGVPKSALESLLVITKTSENLEIRKNSRKLLELHAPPKWMPLIKNRLEFHQEKVLLIPKELRKKLSKLSTQVAPDIAAFFSVILQKEYQIYPKMIQQIDEELYSISKKMPIEEKLLQPGAVVFVNGKTRLKKIEIKEKLQACGLEYAQKYSSKVTHVVIGSNPKEWKLDPSKFKLLTENHLQTYFSKIAPAYLEQAVEEGDTQLSENLLQMLLSQDETNTVIALELLDSGGVPENILKPLLVISKAETNAKNRAKARKLLELFAPIDWLPMIKSKLLFKNINAKAKETDLNKKLDKLAKETSLDLAAILSIGLFEKYGRGLRFMLRKTKCKDYLTATKLLLKDTHLDFSKGMGYTSWRETNPEAVILFGNFKTGINFPEILKDLGKIESIDFHNCKFSAMPKTLSIFTDIKHLDLSHNSITKLPLWIHKLEKLEVLNLQMNCFQQFPERIATIKNLKKLDLRFNRKDFGFVEMEIPEEVRKALPDCEILI